MKKEERIMAPHIMAAACCMVAGDGGTTTRHRAERRRLQADYDCGGIYSSIIITFTLHIDYLFI